MVKYVHRGNSYSVNQFPKFETLSKCAFHLPKQQTTLTTPLIAGWIKHNLHRSQKVGDSSSNNYYDKKGYSFSPEPANALSLRLSLWTPASFVEKQQQQQQKSLTQHAFISAWHAAPFKRQTTSTKETEKNLQMKAKV